MVNSTNEQTNNMSSLLDWNSLVYGFFFQPDSVEHPKPRRKKTAVVPSTEQDPPPVVPDNDPTEVTFFHDFVAGGLAGSASVIVGHHMDTMYVPHVCHMTFSLFLPCWFRLLSLTEYWFPVSYPPIYL
jgi:hypothetical protein